MKLYFVELYAKTKKVILHILGHSNLDFRVFSLNAALGNKFCVEIFSQIFSFPPINQIFSLIIKEKSIWRV